RRRHRRTSQRRRDSRRHPGGRRSRVAEPPGSRRPPGGPHTHHNDRPLAIGGCSMTWEFIRITGLVALAFLTVSVALGVAGPALHRPTSRLASVSMHMTAAVGGTVLVIAHILFAIADSWIT